MCLYLLSSVLLISLVFFCCPVMCLYVLSSVLLISLVFFMLSCYVSLCSEFCVAHFFSLSLCCPVMCLYVLSSVLLISLVFFMLSCYVSLCSEFRVAHFFSLFCVVLLCVFMFWVPCCSFHKVFLCCPVMCLYVLSSVLLIFLVFFVLSCYVSLCSEFRVAHFFSVFYVVLLCVFMFW
jgi:hypothetical protein